MPRRPPRERRGSRGGTWPVCLSCGGAAGCAGGVRHSGRMRRPYALRRGNTGVRWRGVAAASVRSGMTNAPPPAPPQERRTRRRPRPRRNDGRAVHNSGRPADAAAAAPEWRGPRGGTWPVCLSCGGAAGCAGGVRHSGRMRRPSALRRAVTGVRRRGAAAASVGSGMTNTPPPAPPQERRTRRRRPRRNDGRVAARAPAGTTDAPPCVTQAGRRMPRRPPRNGAARAGAPARSA